MKISTLIKKILFPNTYNSQVFKQYLRKHGVIIGEHTEIYSPNHVGIDIRKPGLIKIGDYCSITQNVTILAHDYSISVARKKFGQFVGGSLPVTIGDNCFIGVKTTILMGTTIGNNCIVGCNSVVKGTFPDNVVIAGNPAKIVCTLEEYYQKKLSRWKDDAITCAKAIYNNLGHIPTIEEMSDGYAWLYLPHTRETIERYPNFFDLTADDYDSICEDFLKSKPIFDSYEDFIKSINFEGND